MVRESSGSPPWRDPLVAALGRELVEGRHPVAAAVRPMLPVLLGISGRRSTMLKRGSGTGRVYAPDAVSAARKGAAAPVPFRYIQPSVPGSPEPGRPASGDLADPASGTGPGRRRRLGATPRSSSMASYTTSDIRNLALLGPAGAGDASWRSSVAASREGSPTIRAPFADESRHRSAWTTTHTPKGNAGCRGEQTGWRLSSVPHSP